MMQRVDFFKKRMDDTIFILHIYEMHSKKMPTDNLMVEMCNKYRERILSMSEEYLSFYGCTENIKALTEGGVYGNGI